MKRTVIFSGVVFGLALLVFGVWRFRVATTPQPIEPSPVSSTTPIDARIVWSSSVFRVANPESREWQDCVFMLNPEHEHGGYLFHRDVVKVHEILEIPHGLFQTSAGTMYAYEIEKPDAFAIRCTNVEGQIGLYSGHD